MTFTDIRTMVGDAIGTVLEHKPHHPNLGPWIALDVADILDFRAGPEIVSEFQQMSSDDGWQFPEHDVVVWLRDSKVVVWVGNDRDPDMNGLGEVESVVAAEAFRDAAWDAVCAHIRSTHSGATLHQGCWEIPVDGRIVMVDDDYGVRIGVYNEPDEPPTRFVEFPENAAAERICTVLDRIVCNVETDHIVARYEGWVAFWPGHGRLADLFTVDGWRDNRRAIRAEADGLDVDVPAPVDCVQVVPWDWSTGTAAVDDPWSHVAANIGTILEDWVGSGAVNP